jgi:hypothetical protein
LKKKKKKKEFVGHDMMMYVSNGLEQISFEYKNWEYKNAIPNTKTYPTGSQNAAIPVRQESVARIDQPKGKGHVSGPFLAFLKLLQELEVPWNNHSFTRRRSLHDGVSMLVAKEE